MQADHDQTKPIRVRNLRAWVDDGADGFYMLKLSYEIHPEDAHYVANRRGMSAAMRAPIAGRDDVEDGQTAVELSADHAWFDDDALLAAETSVVGGGLPRTDIRTQRAYQFSFVPDPQIFVTVVLPLAGTVVTGAFGSALWDAVKALFRRRRTPPNGNPDKPTRVNMRLEDGERSLSGIVETQDGAVADRAIDAFEGLAREFMAAPSSPDSSDRRVLVWDDVTAGWMPHEAAPVDPPIPPVEPEEY